MCESFCLHMKEESIIKKLRRNMGIVLTTSMLLSFPPYLESLTARAETVELPQTELAQVPNGDKMNVSAEENLLPNGDFEKVNSSGGTWQNGIQPEGWSVWHASGQGAAAVTTDVYYSGNKAVQILHQASARTGLSTNVAINGGGKYQLSAWIKTKDVASGGGVFVRTQYYKQLKGVDGSTQDVKIGDGPATVKMQGTMEWNLREILLNVPGDAKYVRIEPFFETGTGTAWFDMMKLIPLPESPENSAAYDEIRSHWYQKLIGGSGTNTADPDVTAYIQQLTERVSNSQGTGYLDTIQPDIQASSLWDGLINQNNTNSAAISAAYGRLREMSLIYGMETSTLHKDPRLRDAVMAGMAWMHKYQYNKSKPITGNWWDFEIGSPQAYMDILVLLYDDLSIEQRNTYLKVIDTFVPDPKKRVQNANVTETGANLLDKALVVVLRGAVGKDEFKVLQGRNSMSGEFQYVTKGDGIYEDGSLVQHSNIAYTGAYGAVLLGRMADLLYLLHDSKWDIDDPNVNNVYRWVKDSFEPLIYRGAVMDMVKGRSISRENDSDHLTGRAIIRTMARLAAGAPAQEASQMQSMVKEWVQSDTSFPNYYANMPLYEMNLIKNIVNDSAIVSRGALSKHQNFAGMDRAVMVRHDFAFGLSLFSNRISAFEYGNGENKKGWYTGMGMTSLYNQDLTQYSNMYWPTVDMYRLPGTTTDAYAPAPVEWASYYNAKSWVGGTSLNQLYGSSGMEFSLSKSTGSSLEGKKSWFMFDDEIVALGSDIKSTDNRKVETIVENRQLGGTGTNTLSVNGSKKTSTLGWNETMNNVSWAHLQGNVTGNDTGFYFPGKSTIIGKREARTGSWSQVNSGGSTTSVTRNYLSLAFDHGKMPSEASYAYVLLPNKSSEETANYSTQPDVEIIAQNNIVHAVYEKKLGIRAYQFWQAGTSQGVHSEQPASVMWEEKNGELSLSISDPTQQQDAVVISIDRKITSEIKKDPSITVLQTAPFLKILVNTKGTIGRSHSIMLKYDPSASSGFIRASSK